jgi:hypothetical protein
MKTLPLAGLASIVATLAVGCSSSATLPASSGAGFNIGAEKQRSSDFTFGEFHATAPGGYEVQRASDRMVMMAREGSILAAMAFEPEAESRDPEGCAGYVLAFAHGFLSGALEQEVHIDPVRFGMLPEGGCGFEGVTGDGGGAAVVTSVLQRPAAFAVVFCFVRADDFTARQECSALQASVK